MKIVFVETPSPWLIRKNTHVPLGLLYLATVLRKNNYNTILARPKHVEDFRGFQDADIICMSGTTLEYPMNVECVAWIKDHFPHIKVFIGGTHITAMYKDVLESNLFDAIGVGEGEFIISDMVSDAERGELKKIYFSNGFIKDLDTIPFPDRTLIGNAHSKGLFAYDEHYIGIESENIVTSRGCPYNCAFCASKSTWSRKIRYRSTGNVVSEMRQIIESTGIRQFGIWDDTLTPNKGRCLELCKKLERLDIAWRCLARADSLDSELCVALIAAGCKEVCVGLESGDQRVLNFLNKKTDIESTLKGCKNAHKAGLKVRALFMTGTPGERENTPELNRDYINRLDFDIISLSTFTPLPGSPIWDNPNEYNCEILTKDFTKYNEYSFVKKNGKKILNEYEPLIHNKFLTISQMKDNVERMRIYVNDTGKINEG